MNKIWISMLIIAVSVLALLTLHLAGSRARLYGRSFAISQDNFTVYVLNKTTDITLLWDERKLSGRIAINFGKFLHFLPEVDAKVDTMNILKTASQSHFHTEKSSHKDYLWFAFQKNIVREIYNVIPVADFLKRFDLRDEPKVVNDVIEHEFGSRRIITTRLPSIAEPVLINIDASYFSSTDPSEFLNILLKSRLRSDFITVCLAEDNPDVTENERLQLLEFIRLLSKRAEITLFSVPTGVETVAK